MRNSRPSGSLVTGRLFESASWIISAGRRGYSSVRVDQQFQEGWAGRINKLDAWSNLKVWTDGRKSWHWMWPILAKIVNYQYHIIRLWFNECFESTLIMLKIILTEYNVGLFDASLYHCFFSGTYF